MPVADATRSQLRNEAKRRAREAAARRRAEAAARRRAEEARRREARRRARQARLAAQQANETRATPGGPTRAGRVREAREAAGSGVQRSGRAGHPRGPRRSRARTTTGAEAYPALDALFSTRAGRGDLLTPEQFENWRVEQGNFTTRRGKRGARAPSYADYLSFVERRRGLRGRPELRERVARGEFASPVRAARQEEEFPAGLYGRLPTSTADALARNARNAVEPDDDGFLDEIRDAFGEVWGAVRPGGKLDDTLGAGGRLDRALGMGSAAGKVQEFSGWLDSQGDRFEDWLRSYLGDRKISVSTAPGLVVDDVDAASIAAVPVKIPTQIASSLAYTPAFAAFAVSDPKGTAEGIARYASQIWDDPSGFLLERPGDALMLLLGGKGLVSGRLPRVVSAAARGDVRAAARAAVAPAPSTGALTRGTPLARVSPERLVPGGRERRIVRERELVARIESAEPEVLVKLANQLVIPKLPHVSKRQALVAQSEAIRAVLEQTSPRMRAAFFLDSRTFTRPAARYRLNKLVTGNQIVETLGLVERGPDGVLRISDRFPALQALTERVGRSSVRQEGKKIELGMLNPETAAERAWAPWRIMQGAEYFDSKMARKDAQTFNPLLKELESRQKALIRERDRLRDRPTEWQRTADVRHRRALKEYERANKALEELGPRVERAHELHDQLVREQAVLDELIANSESTPVAAGTTTRTTVRPQGPTSEFLPNMTFQGGRVGPEIHAAIRQQQALVRKLSDEYARAARAFTPFHEARAARYEALKTLAWTQDQVEAASRARAMVALEADRDLARLGETLEGVRAEREASAAARGIQGAQETPPGQPVYTPYKVDDLIIRPALPQKIRDRLGIPQKPGRYEFTGRSMRSGRVGNVVRLTAREELATLRYQGRLDAWKDAVKSSITGKELLDRIKNGESLSDYAAVRVKAGKSTLATRQLTDLFHTIPIDSARNFLDITSGHLGEVVESIRLIVRDADKSGQVRFFKPGEVGLRPLEMSRPGTIRATAQFVNQMAKTSVLFLAGPAYALPNLIGQWGFSGIHKGVQQPFTDFWDAPRIMGKVAPETRARARVASGTGMTRIIQPGMGPISILRNLNHRLGDFYSRFLDDFWREGAFYYEAKQRGYRTPEDITRLVNTGTKRGTREHADLLEINRAVDDHFGAFDRMTDFEKNYMQEAVFFWPWIRASAVLAGKVISNHPVKAALLQIGGSYSYEQARQDFISMFTEHGVDRKTAEGMTDDLMRLMPGIFMIGDQAINPMAVALYSSPLEIGRVLGPATKGDWDGFLSNLVDQGTPFVSLAGALIEGVFNPRADPTGQRVLESIQGYFRDATLLRRLFGDQGKWFTFTEAQAYMQRFGGSFMPRGINIEGLEASTKRRLQEEAGPAPPKPHVYETLSDRALNSDRFPDEMKQNIATWRDGQDLIRYGKVTLARQLGLMQTNDSETPSVSRLTRRQEYAIKIGVLNRIRPGYLPGNWRDVYHDVWETHSTDAIERLIRAINTGLSFADVYGASISSRMDEVLNAATK